VPGQPIAGQPGPGGLLVFHWSPLHGWVAVPASGNWGDLLGGQQPPTEPPTGGEGGEGEGGGEEPEPEPEQQKRRR